MWLYVGCGVIALVALGLIVNTIQTIRMADRVSNLEEAIDWDQFDAFLTGDGPEVRP